MAERKINILLVDDDQVDRKAVARLISEQVLPYNLETASSVEEGLRKLKETVYDIILLDYQLGDGTGLEVLSHTGSTPVIFVTGSGDEDIAVNAMRHGARDYLVKDPERNYLTVLPLTIENVLKSKHAEEALRESEEKFRSSFENAAMGMALLGLEGKFLRVNGFLCSMFGYTEEELLRKNFMDITDPDDLQNDLDNTQRVLEGDIDTFQIEKRYIHKQGQTIWGLLNASVVRDANGKPSYFIAHVQDITKRKQVEEERKELIKELGTAVQQAEDARKEAEDATKLKDKFVSLVSHDLKTPLATMIGYLKLVAEENVEPLNEGAKAILNSAINAGRKMNRLIDDILSITRLKTGTMKPKLEFVDAKFLASKAVMDFQYLADQKGINLVKEIHSKTRLYADPVLFYEVIHNLMSNAIKFCNRGDSIRIFNLDDRPSTIAIADSGVGMEQGRLLHLFDYETKTSTIGTEGESGTGLGLPLCRDIMEAHDGTLTVESSPGKGSTFYAELPFVRPVVLLVEDEFVAREMICRMIGKMDVEIMKANNGVEALEIARKKRPHLILLDLFMPEMDGFELLKRLKNDPGLKDVPVIVLTAHGDMENRERAFQLGAEDLVSKPTTEDELIPRIRKQIG